jgi:hypothetical protein
MWPLRDAGCLWVEVTSAASFDELPPPLTAIAIAIASPPAIRQTAISRRVSLGPSAPPCHGGFDVALPVSLINRSRRLYQIPLRSEGRAPKGGSV